MFDALRNLLTENATKRAEPENQPLKIQIAASVLLLEASHADDECSEAEFDHIRSTLRELFKITDAAVQDLLELASSKREHEVDLWQFSNLINQEFTQQEKFAILESVWRIIYLDGKLDRHEDHFVHKLANLLRLTHKELIDSKIRVKAALTASTANK